MGETGERKRKREKKKAPTEMTKRKQSKREKIHKMQEGEPRTKFEKNLHEKR